ncbi:S-layer homology domain-containing protein [Ureibacillus manganicus]|nr:S-layer homology domain-containing protein [Ureibacillus manganicus]
MSKNKFFATTATAALVASAIMPAASLAAETKTFTDAGKIAEYAKPAVDYLVGKGAITGFEDGSFNPQGELTRAQAVTILVNALNIDVKEGTKTNFEDAKDHWATEEIAALQAYNNDIIKGFEDGSFRPNEKITRAQLALIITKAYNLKQDDSAVLNFTDNTAAWSKDAVNTLASLGIVAGTSKTTFAPNAIVTREQAAAFFHRTEVESVRLEVETTEAKVTSVSAINAKEVVVKFNTALAEGTTKAQLEAAFALEGANLVADSAVLSQDRKSVTLTLDTTEVTNAKVTVAALDTAKKDSNGVAIKTAQYTSLLTFEDTTAPAVAKVEAKGTTSVITFTEPVKEEGTVSLNGSVITSTTDYELSADGKTLTVKNLEAEKSYKVDIVGATDFADNIANPIAVNFTVAKPVVDNTKPTVTSSVNGTKITLDFSEELVKQNLDVTAGDDEYAKVTVGSTEFFLKDAQQHADDKTKFTFDALSVLGSEKFINTNVKVEGFKDVANNAGDAFEFAATLQKDTSAPKFVSVSSKMLAANDSGSTDVDAIYLTFDEEVTVTGDFTLKTKNGIVYTSATPISLSNVASGEDVDGNGKVEGAEKYTVKVDVDLDENATYTFELGANAVADAAGNKIADALSVSFTSGKFVVAPGTVTDSLQLAASNPIVVVDNNVFTVEYAADVTTSALTASNYTLGGKALPAGTQLQFVDGTNKVRFTLPESSITANGNYVFEVKNVVDTNGNTLKDGKATATIALNENIAPTATKVTVVNSKTFTVDFTEAIANQASATGLTVKIAGTTVTPVSASVANGKLTVTTTADFTLTDSISVEFKDTNLVDANGNKVKNGVVTK